VKAKAKIRIVAAGECPRCGKKYIRVPIVNAAACTCGNPDSILVPLEPTLIVPASIYKRYAKIAQLAGVDIEKLIGAVLVEGVKRKLELKPLPNITVAVRE
jgi:hypothetical protein